MEESVILLKRRLLQVGYHISDLPMKDQGAIPKETQDELWNRALDIMVESVHKPDDSLRSCAHNQKCYNELMWIRDEIIDHLHTLRRTK